MVNWPFQRNQRGDVDLSATEETPEQLPVEEPTSVSQQQELNELPAEVQEYYQSEQQQRSGMAWLLGLATLGVTLLLTLGLFFGGRWVYRKVANPAANNPTNQQAAKDHEKQKSGASTDTSKQNQGTSSTNTTTPNTTPPAPTGSTPSRSTPSSPAPQRTTGGKTPDTGPGDVVAIFVVTSIAGAVLYQAVARKQLR